MINCCVYITYSLICFDNYLDGRKHKIRNLYQAFKQYFIHLSF